jgi:hypothetical protein
MKRHAEGDFTTGAAVEGLEGLQSKVAERQMIDEKSHRVCGRR